MKIKSLLLSLFAVAMAVSCGSSRVNNQEDVEIIIPCGGVEFKTNGEFFRANAMGFSNSMQIASEKAMNAARTELASALETTVKAVTASYISSYEENQSEEARSRFQAMARQVVNQKLNGIRTICEKTMKSADGQYKCYVAIELAGLDVAKEIGSQISNDSKLRTDFEYQKFQEVFEKEMAEFAN